jgi:hypothetical protein
MSRIHIVCGLLLEVAGCGVSLCWHTSHGNVLAAALLAMLSAVPAAFHFGGTLFDCLTGARKI